MNEKKSIEELKRIFSNPPREYRPMPQWSWNGNVTRERITEQIEQFAEQGCGGLFMHARPGFANGYITDEWFELWAFALQEAKRVGIEFHIYDEFTVPGGVAGGNTIAENPTVIQHELRLEPVRNRETKTGESFAVLPNGDLEYTGDPTAGDIIGYATFSEGSVEKAEQDTATHAIVLAPCSGAEKLPPPDILQRPTAEAFIRTTHEKYQKSVGDAFGKDVRYVFCDEPHIYCSRNRLACSRDFLREFYHDHAYRLEERIAELCLNTGKFTEVRFDYWKTLDRLFNDNFMKPMYDWCADNNLMFSGHLIENRWPNPLDVPSNMSSLRWMHAPGEDLLGFQFDNEKFENNKLYLLNLKELSSIRNQLGCEWTLVETCGGGGYNLSLPYFKSCEDFVLAFGVNVIDPHLAHVTLSGIGKYDWPQTLSDHSPWWQFYRPHADHVGRVNAALSQAREHSRILLLMPTTTSWCYYTGSEFDSVSGGVSAEKMDWIKRSQLDLCFDLYRAHIDYDLGDEIVIEDIGSVDQGRLLVGERAYDAVILPPAMENITSSTLSLLRDFADGDGSLFRMCSPEMVDGRKSENAFELGRLCAETGELIRALHEKFEFPFSDMPGNLVIRHVDLDGDELLFLSNPWPEPIEGEFEISGGSMQRLDTATGKIRPAVFERKGEKLRHTLKLPPRGHELLLVSDEPVKPAAVQNVSRKQIQTEPAGITRLAPNLLYIDYCDIEACGVRREDINTVHAEELNWKLQGFTGIPWTKQYRRTIMDREVDPESEFTVRYRFTVGDGFDGPLCAGIERAWLYDIYINGEKLDQDGAERWFDPDFRTVPIQAQPGENVLTLTAKPFHVLCAIMPVYIIGDFSLSPAERGFRIDPARDLEKGDWTDQGMPFYADAVRYTFTFILEEKTADPVIRLPEFDEPVARIGIDGNEIEPVVHPPYEVTVPEMLSAGEHRIDVDVFGNMKNMMGSHFSDLLPGIWSFQYNPEAMPPGNEYTFTPSGMTGGPAVLV